MPPRRLLPLLSLLLAGCGTAEYEAEMKKVQDKLRRFDEEAKYLGAPIQLPTVKGPTGAPKAAIQLFLRLPRGLSPIPRPEVRTGAGGVAWYDYLAQPPAGAFAWASVAAAPADDKAFTDNLMKDYPPSSPIDRKPYTTKPEGRPGVTFTRSVFEDANYRYSLNVHQGSKQQLAVFFASPKAQAAQAARPIDMSLESFGFENTIGPAQAAFQPGGPLESVPK